MDIKNRKVEELIPYVNNPRDNSAAVDAVASSIAEFGFKVPIIVDRNNVVVTGHTRLQAAKKLGLAEVPVLMADDLSDAQVKAFRIADNKVSELASWNEELLEAELAAIKDTGGIDMGEFGFTEDELGALDDVEEDTPPEVEEVADPITKPGDLYQLGRHRLLCGDSTSIEDVATLTAGAKIDLLLTDPPYNVAYEGQNGMTIENDSMDSDKFLEFLTDVNKAADSVLKEGGAFYIWHSDSEGINFRKSILNAGWMQKQLLIWVKDHFVLGRQDYQNQHEPCLYGWKPGAGHYFSDKRTESTVIEDRPNLEKMDKAELKELCKELLGRQPVETTILRENKPLSNDIHPTMKPVKLFARLILNSTRKGEKVLDLFGGSGTTLVACEQLGRQAYLMELDPRYCDAIVKRFEELTGQKAQLIAHQEEEQLW